MAQLIRQYSPRTKIILGGHGTSLGDIEKRVPCDYVCRGEGIVFLRQLLGEDVKAPIKHPLRYSSFNRYILGTPISNKRVPEGIIMPGVGCVNGCRFCSTSHFFQKQYIPFTSVANTKRKWELRIFLWWMKIFSNHKNGPGNYSISWKNTGNPIPLIYFLLQKPL